MQTLYLQYYSVSNNKRCKNLISKHFLSSIFFLVQLLTLKYTRKLFYKDLIVVSQPISSLSSHRYHPIAIISSLSSHRYHLIAIISSLSSHRYHFIAIITSLSSHRYHLIAIISSLSSHRYHLIAFTSITLHDKAHFTYPSAWLKDPEHPLIRRISLKSAAASSLSLDTVEDLQVYNIYDYSVHGCISFPGME